MKDMPPRARSMARRIHWLGDSLEVIREFPDTVRAEVGGALHAVQHGDTPSTVKPLRHLTKGGSGVYEVVTRDATGTYRVAYIAKLRKAVYVLHAFQKKSKHGIATPKQEIDMIRERLRQAIEIDQEEGHS